MGLTVSCKSPNSHAPSFTACPALSKRYINSGQLSCDDYCSRLILARDQCGFSGGANSVIFTFF